MSARRAEAIALAVVLGLALLAGRSLLAAGFYDAHDNLLNLHRLAQMEKCFADGQIPCRWAPDLAFGFGQPLFNYYPPLPSYLGFGLTRIGLSEIEAVKASMLLALLGAGASMFVLARSFFGRPAAVVAAVLYTWAPYRAIDVYVRGALAEAVGLALLPLVFWGAYRVLSRTSRSVALDVPFALAWSALLLSHVLVVVMAAPFYAAWCAVWIVRELPPRERLVDFAAVHGAAAALAAFFWLPAVWERDLVQLAALTTLYPWSQVANNFLAFDQVMLGTRPWGYGAVGTADGMSLFVGVLHWGTAVVAVAALAWHVRRQSRSDREAWKREPRTIATVAMAATALASVLMTLPVSRMLWSLPGLAFLQFPWRFLGVAALGLAFTAAWGIEALRDRPRLAHAAAALVALLAVATSWSWFRPSRMHVVSGEALLTEGHLARTRHGAFDYVPRGVELAALAEASRRRDPETAHVTSGAATLETVSRGSRHLDFSADVSSGADAVIRLHVFDFPGWRVEVDGAPVAREPVADPLARIHVRVPPGRHRIDAVFGDTPVRRIANGTTVATAAALVFWLGFRLARNARARRAAGATR